VVTSSVARYRVNEQTVVEFEFDPPPGFHPAGVEEIAGRVRDAVEPAVQAARVVLDKVRHAGPDEVKLKFGIKISGGANWLIAKAATDANFEIEMTWKPSPAVSPTPADSSIAMSPAGSESTATKP
jgi:NTP-dependent ternary system trypsin peptidase co-occuring protein